MTIFIFGDAQMCWVFFNLGGGVVGFCIVFFGGLTSIKEEVFQME